jgi:hypothetical protein
MNRGPSVGTRAIPKVMIVLSGVMVANGALYWLFGPARTLGILTHVFALTHPRFADGSPNLPPLPVLTTSYVEHPVGIALHYVFMPLLLVAALFQFSVAVRAARPAFHRWLGRAFFAALLVGVGGAVSKIVRGDLYGGTLSRVQFTGMALTTLFCAAMGAAAALRREFARHERWMWRTYCVVWSSSVMSRLGILLVVPLLWRWWGIESETNYVLAYNLILAASWIVPFFAADPLLARGRERLVVGPEVRGERSRPGTRRPEADVAVGPDEHAAAAADPQA